MPGEASLPGSIEGHGFIVAIAAGGGLGLTSLAVRSPRATALADVVLGAGALLHPTGSAALAPVGQGSRSGVRGARTSVVDLGDLLR